MPLFGRPKREKNRDALDDPDTQKRTNGSAIVPSNPQAESIPALSNDPNRPNDSPTSTMSQEVADKNAVRSKLVFHCQLAHGSKTEHISGFTNVRELYEKIAACFPNEIGADPSQILFCTLNTHKMDMSRLLGGQIGLDDFIFAHVKDQPKVVDIVKSEDALGLTITDNGAGYAFIKRIKEGSIMDRIEGILVGDHIEKINDQSLVGFRHFEVAKRLKEIPKGATFSMRLVEPHKGGFTAVSQASRKGGKLGSDKVGGGKATLRLKASGPATVQVAEEVIDVAVEKINNLLESFLGISDAELAQTVWEIGSAKDNPSDFAIAIDSSDVKEFGFTDNFIFDLWGACNDAKAGRLKSVKEFNENF